MSPAADRTATHPQPVASSSQLKLDSDTTGTPQASLSDLVEDLVDDRIW